MKNKNFNISKIITIFVLIFVFITILSGIFSLIKNWSNGIVNKNATEQAIIELEKQYAQKEIELQKEYEKKLDEHFSSTGEDIESETIENVFYASVIIGKDFVENGLYINTQNGGFIDGNKTLDEKGANTAQAVYAINNTFGTSINIYTPQTLNTLIIYEGNFPAYVLKLKDSQLFSYMYQQLDFEIEPQGSTGAVAKLINDFVFQHSNYTNNEINLSNIFDCYKYNLNGTKSFIKECKTKIYVSYVTHSSLIDEDTLNELFPQN